MDHPFSPLTVYFRLNSYHIQDTFRTEAVAETSTMPRIQVTDELPRSNARDYSTHDPSRDRERHRSRENRDRNRDRHRRERRDRDRPKETSRSKRLVY